MTRTKGMVAWTAAGAGATAGGRCKEAATNLRSQAAGEAAAGSRIGSRDGKSRDVNGKRKESVARGASRRRDCKTGVTAGARRREATARTETAGSAQKAGTLADWGAVMGVKERSSNEMVPLGWQRRASGALARRAA